MVFFCCQDPENTVENELQDIHENAKKQVCLSVQKTASSSPDESGRSC